MNHTTDNHHVPPPGFRQGIAVLVAALIVVALVLRQALTPAGPDAGTMPAGDERHTTEFAIFNTYGRVTVYAAESTANHAFREILTATRALHDTINRFDPDSELSRLNRTAATEPFACSDRLWDILLQARRAYRVTHGAFDVSVGPLMALWGFHRKRETLPTEAEIRKTLERVGLDKVRFDDQARTVRFTRPGMSLDFGGIAKGYALDMVSAILRRRGITRGLVDLGGNICCLPAPPPGRTAYLVGIRNPFDTGTLIGRVRVLGRNIATSGDYERYVTIQGRTIAHIIDPRSGQPVATVHSVTVITPRGVDSDIFSTAVFVAGEELAASLTRDIPGTTVIRILPGDDDKPLIRRTGPARLLPP
jgi:thiamine biosynthesis lipoprotein ApbE